MKITDALIEAMRYGIPIYRAEWRQSVKLFVDEDSDFLIACKWEDDIPEKNARWIPKAEDLIEDDWRALMKEAPDA